MIHGPEIEEYAVQPLLQRMLPSPTTATIAHDTQDFLKVVEYLHLRRHRVEVGQS